VEEGHASLSHQVQIERAHAPNPADRDASIATIIRNMGAWCRLAYCGAQRACRGAGASGSSIWPAVQWHEKRLQITSCDACLVGS
jgi:hypothetical protein